MHPSRPIDTGQSLPAPLSLDSSTHPSRQDEDSSLPSLRQRKRTQTHELDDEVIGVIPAMEKKNKEVDAQDEGGSMAHAETALAPFNLGCHKKAKDPNGGKSGCLEKDEEICLRNSKRADNSSESVGIVERRCKPS
jgi:hypothetical protein